jgi:threonine dehydratase
LQSIEDFKKASRVIESAILRTSLLKSDFFTLTYGNNVYLKPENMQNTGSYKIRGAYYKISALSDEEKSRGIVTASAGNHAQGVAFAARKANAAAKIVMPIATPLVKVNNTKSYGAEVILYGDVFDEAAEYANRISQEEGYTYVHPFDDLEVATGQGTIAYEILQDLPDADIILVPVGGGGLAAGVSTLVKLLNPGIKVIGVEPSGAASMYESVKRGSPVTLDAIDTIAEGVAVRTPGSKVFPYVQNNVDDFILVDDHELINVFLDVMEKHKMIVENAGLLTVAALKHLDVKNKNVVCILSGGNMDVITLSSIVQRGLINRDRIFTFSVLLPDKPGQLLNVAQVVAGERGNIIKLEHNQFVSIDRNETVELQVTLEAFGTAHKEKIMESLRRSGYKPTIYDPTLARK